MKRTFIAIKIPFSKSAGELIGDIKLNLKDERIKWVESWNLHITLYFIGDTDENSIDEIGKHLAKSLDGMNSFKLKCESLGVFKNTYNPKALWIGIGNSEDLNGLKSVIDKTMLTFGFLIEERTFKPHLTIGRMKFVQDKSRIKKIIDNYKYVKFQHVVIKEVLFYESILTPKGPVYRVLRKFPLN